MSMSTYVQGLMKKTEKYEKMESILILCKELNINPPQEVYEYFELQYDGYCKNGIIVPLPKGIVEHYTDDEDEIWEIDLYKIPDGVTKIRFVNSY